MQTTQHLDGRRGMSGGAPVGFSVEPAAVFGLMPLDGIVDEAGIERAADAVFTEPSGGVGSEPLVTECREIAVLRAAADGLRETDAFRAVRPGPPVVLAEIAVEVHGRGYYPAGITLSNTLPERSFTHDETRRKLGGMDVYEIRHRNFRRLISGLPKNRPDDDGITAAAELLNKAQSQVSHFGGAKPSKNIGPKIAREIEAAFGLGHGELDHDREFFSSESGGKTPPSHLLRPDPEILHDALLALTAEQAIGGPWPHAGRRLADLYDMVAKEGGRLTAATNARLMKQAFAKANKARGVPDVRSDDGGSRGKDQRGAAASE